MVLVWAGSITERFDSNPDGRHQPQSVRGWKVGITPICQPGNPGAGLPIGIFENLSRKIVIIHGLCPETHVAVWLGEAGSETAAEEQDGFLKCPLNHRLQNNTKSEKRYKRTHLFRTGNSSLQTNEDAKARHQVN